MPIPTEHDARLCEIDDLAAVVMIKLRTLQRAGAHGKPETVREPLRQYVEAVCSLAELKNESRNPF